MTILHRTTNHHDPVDLDTDKESKRIQLRDGNRIVAFTGVKLASVSSEREDSLRWTEIDIYRSDAGRFILNRVGVSVVAHTIDCDQVQGKKRHGIDRLELDETPPKHREPCSACNPDILALLHTDPASLTFEEDRSWAAICDDAHSMIEALYTTRQGVRALSSLASSALADAASQDPVVAAAYNVVVELR